MNTHSNHSVQLLTRTIILNTKGSRIIMYHRTDTSVHLFGIKNGMENGIYYYFATITDNNHVCLT